MEKDTILNWTQSLGYVCTFGAFDYTDVIRLSKSCYDANMNRATFKKRVKVKESNLQSVSYFRLWFVFFCEAMIHNVVTGSQASCIVL